MKITLRESEAFVLDLRTRMPFRYGIMTLTGLPHYILRLAVEIDGCIHYGLSSDNLAPKWFTKNPATSIPDELQDILAVIAHARQAAITVGPAENPFELWSRLYAAQKAWGAGRFPPLLWNFGVTMVERAMIDAFCRARQTTFAKALLDNSLGTRLGAIFPELEGIAPAELLPPAPLPSIIVRHTVGLTDPLEDADIPAADRVNDGLPESLEGDLDADGITHLKIKLSGNVESDLARLHRISAVVEARGKSCAFTLDGNENFRTVEPFIALWESLLADPGIAHFLKGLIFVEQPFHRDVALSPSTGEALRTWSARPPIIIDESDAEAGTLAIALAGGYVGTSHKNCKGVFKGIANAALIAHRRLADPTKPLLMSAEDLTNIGPIALNQDLAALAALGITHAERNGHHYFKGLSQFPASVQSDILKAHPELFHRHSGGFAAMTITHGQIAIDSINAAPFGYAGEIDLSGFAGEKEWGAAIFG